MKKTELVVKSREAMMAAVQLYNNPQITFKTETFITLAIIAWTYLLHAYYANNDIDYRYYHMNGQRKIYDKTKYGAYKHWELEKCLDYKKSPIDDHTKQNLKFLIGLRHEIEHQMTKRIDDSVSAKMLACSINYNYYIKKIFGNVFGVDQELGMAIQFSPIEAEQKETLFRNKKIADNVKNFISTFEDTLTPDEMGNTHYAYRVVFARVDGKRVNGDTDEVIRFLSADSQEAKELNTKYAVIKETEKKKYLSKQIVDMMINKGYKWFNVGRMTSFWQNELKSRDEYGLYITGTQWMWYENWIPVIEQFCKEYQKTMDSVQEKIYKPKQLAELMQKKGYHRFNVWWLNQFAYKENIDKKQTEYGFYNQYNQFVWKESVIPLLEEYCGRNKTRLN